MNTSPHKDQYIFMGQSLSGEYGFDCFRRPETGLYYFTFNGADGGPKLFSQGYTTVAGLDNGVLSVLTNAMLDHRFEILKLVDGGEVTAYQLVLKAGNHQEIARSRPEDVFLEINRLKAMCLTIGPTAPKHDFLDTSAEGQVSPTDEADLLKPPQPKKREALPASSFIPSARQLFHLMFYIDNKTCKIEHVITGDREVIQGVSGDAIADFVCRYLPEDWGICQEKDSPAKSVATSMMSTEQPSNSPVQTPKVLPRPTDETQVETATPSGLKANPSETPDEEGILEERVISIEEFMQETGKVEMDHAMRFGSRSLVQQPTNEMEVSTENPSPQAKEIAEKESSPKEKGANKVDVLAEFLKTKQSVEKFTSKLLEVETDEAMGADSTEEQTTVYIDPAKDMVLGFIEGKVNVELKASEGHRKFSSLSNL